MASLGGPQGEMVLLLGANEPRRIPEGGLFLTAANLLRCRLFHLAEPK